MTPIEWWTIVLMIGVVMGLACADLWWGWHYLRTRMIVATAAGMASGVSMLAILWLLLTKQ